MAHIVADRVKETSTTTGTGNVTLAGAATAFQAFSAVCANNDTFFYCIAHQTANEWEIGYGTYVSATPAVARTTVIESSNADAAVNFSSGTKDVFITNPAVGHSWGVLSPSQITADQNDYNPTGLKYASILRLDTDNVRQLTGLQGGFDGRRIMLHCLDAAQGPVILRDESTSSTAAYRFNLPRRRVMLFPGESIELVYDGTSARWTPVHGNMGSSSVAGDDYINVFDDFFTGVNGTGTATEAGETVGAWSWRSTANGTAASTSPASVAAHPGIVQLVTGTTSGNDTRLHLGNSATEDIFPFQDLRYMGFLVRTTDITSIIIKCGLGVDLADATAAAWGTDGVLFEYNSSAASQWRCHTRAASTTTSNTTSVVVTNNEWDLLEAYRLTNGNWSFWVNESLVFTHSTNLPTTVMANIGCFVETQTAAARNVQVDWIAFRTARLGQRYT
jgi:hypothetical protein